MSDPDNVARLIAVGSALATVANMSVGYASYRRKRPRLGAKLQAQRPGFDVQGERKPVFELLLTNRSETPVRINWAYLTTRDAAPAALPRWLVRVRVMTTTGLVFLDGSHVRTTCEFPFQLGGMEEEAVTLTVPDCLAFLNDPVQKECRVTVGLSSGRVVRTGWERKRNYGFDCVCPSCCEEGDGQQLSFDDLLQGS